ncbi:FecR domain-containing protein [Sphingobacterium sp. PCS056]|uniref:FecR family protein n=1 Tax=Sphingobacterium sp. PCS056 TaxID=2931400 RepID=UPI00200F87A9|nr:FecR family protein [Sphingobacterium sp. PCS056]UPZ36502.1 FecR domain-containing protein [Sphingobacterium sp. PCS056]
MEDHNTFENSEIKRLLTQYARGIELSANERAMLESWTKKSAINQQIFDRISDTNLLSSDLINYDQSATEEGLKDLNSILDKQVSTRKYKTWFLPAAAVLIIALSISYFLIQHNRILDTERINTSQISNDILPGTNRATLILSNGKTINLDEQKQGIVLTDSSFSYEDGEALANLANVETATLKTPRAGQYDIVLPDGTKVSLNAESSLEYPVKFTGSERRVKLSGEGYFEVAHDKTKPFHVLTSKQDIQVLGTVFNVRTYDNSEATTLVSGKVSIRNSITKELAILNPKQNATVSSKIIRIENVDTDAYTGWKEGMIVANGSTLKEVVSDLERWYDVTFKFQSNYTGNEESFININRKERLSSVLKSLEHIYGVKFQIAGKEVYVRQK